MAAHNLPIRLRDEQRRLQVLHALWLRVEAERAARALPLRLSRDLAAGRRGGYRAGTGGQVAVRSGLGKNYL